MNKFSKILAALALTAFAGTATAVSITGEIGFSSAAGATWDPVDSAGDPTTATLATGVSFTANSAGIDQTVTYTTGDFVGLMNEGVNFFDFQFLPLLTGTPFWEFTVGTGSSAITYSFTMNTINVGEILASDPKLLSLTGTGFISATGYDDTYGTWDFSGNRGTFSAFSASEPAITLLLATGLIGFGFARKARKTA